MNLTLNILSKLFPKDTLWRTSAAEIIGYSYKENRHIVIQDGNRNSPDGRYLVHEYQPADPYQHFINWNIGEYPYKHLLDEKNIREEIVDFEKELKKYE